MEVEIVDKKLHIDSYVYLKSRSRGNKTYWDCRLVRSQLCMARAVTVMGADGEIIVTRGLDQSPHSDHVVVPETCSAEKIVSNLKRLAEEHPEEPPAKILRTELADVHEAVHGMEEWLS